MLGRPAGQGLLDPRRLHENPAAYRDRRCPAARSTSPARRRRQVDAAADPRPRRQAPGDRLRGRSAGLRRPHRPADGRHRLARGLHGLVRLARRPDRDQSPLRDRRAAVQLDPAAQPAGGRVPGEDAGRGAVERSRLEGLGHRLREGRHARRSRASSTRSSTIGAATTPSTGGSRSVRARARRAGCAAAWRRSSRGSRTSRSPSWRSPTCASSTCPRRASATSAARPTTGAGRATPATGPSIAPTSDRTASPRPTRRATCRTSRPAS